MTDKPIPTVNTGPTNDRDFHSWVRPALSPREVEVLRHWVRAESKAATATELQISAGTINTHLARIRAKYAAVGRPVTDKTTLLARALQDEIITLAEL